MKSPGFRSIKEHQKVGPFQVACPTDQARMRVLLGQWRECWKGIQVRTVTEECSREHSVGLNKVSPTPVLLLPRCFSLHVLRGLVCF